MNFPVISAWPLIGIGLIYLFESQYKLRSEETEIAVASRQRQRKQARVVALLKKHGAIPESAILETAWVRVSINSRTGEIRGAILQGISKTGILNNSACRRLKFSPSMLLMLIPGAFLKPTFPFA